MCPGACLLCETDRRLKTCSVRVCDSIQCWLLVVCRPFLGKEGQQLGEDIISDGPCTAAPELCLTRLPLRPILIHSVCSHDLNPCHCESLPHADHLVISLLMQAPISPPQCRSTMQAAQPRGRCCGSAATALRSGARSAPADQQCPQTCCPHVHP